MLTFAKKETRKNRNAFKLYIFAVYIFFLPTGIITSGFSQNVCVLLHKNYDNFFFSGSFFVRGLKMYMKEKRGIVFIFRRTHLFKKQNKQTKGY